jgi:hypothetical protein
MTSIHRTSTALALTLALGVSAAPASARPFDVNASGSYVPSAAASVQATEPSHSVSQPPVIVRGAASGGFDWGDAGIGAAGGIALSMVGLGGAVSVAQNRARRNRRTTALPS